MPLRQLSQEDLIERFGDYRPFLKADGSISAAWEAKIIGTVVLPAPLPLSFLAGASVSRFKAHRLLVPRLTRAMAALHAEPEVWATINDFGGCYAWRRNRRDPSQLSTHCWAVAVDCDVHDNPQGRKGQVHPRAIEIFEGEGFLWGGRFHGESVDPMHWEFADLVNL